MQLHVLRAERDFGARNSARDKLVERQLRSFRSNIQPAVRRLARRHSRLADLAVSFPALLVALAVPREGFKPEPAIARVISGASLAELARAADVALWLRKLDPPLLPRAIPKLPDSHDFRRQIVNHLPRTPKLALVWLDAVANAASWCDEALAIWVAQHVSRHPEHDAIRRLHLISLWAWFSARPGTLAHRFIATPWRPLMQFDSAARAANVWHAAVELYANLGDELIADTWVQPGFFEGYEFVPLRSFAEVVEEGRIMRNCVLTYGSTLVHNHSRLWSMRKDGQRIATLEIGPSGGDGFLGIYEIKAAGNKSVPKEIAWIARRWLHTHDLPSVETKSLAWDAAPLDGPRWFALWKPYWLAKRGFPEWLPLAPSRSALVAL
jgi:hypothetical protein